MYDRTDSMGAAYSKDLRERVLNYIEEGHTRQAAADLFKVSLSPIYHWQRLKKAGESLAAKVRVSKPRKLDYEKLAAYVRADTDATLKEYGQAFQVSHVSIFHALKKLGITRKKSRNSIRNGTKQRGGCLLKKQPG